MKEGKRGKGKETKRKKGETEKGIDWAGKKERRRQCVRRNERT